MKPGENSVCLGGGRVAHASGALWLPELRTAVVADAHLGFGWALRRRGQLCPVDDDRTVPKLLRMAEELAPETIVFLGDLVHAPRPAPEERRAFQQTLAQLHARIVVVLGNHDRGFTRDYPDVAVEVCEEWHGPGLIGVHGDKPLPAGEHVIAGHFHPAFAVVDDAGSAWKMPVFVAGKRVTLLPAFAATASGYDVRAGLPEEVGRDPRIIIASGRRTVDLGPLSRLRTI